MKKNPSTKQGSDCVLIKQLYYCVEVNFIKTSPTRTSSQRISSTTSELVSSPALTTSTKTTNGGITTPTPTQAGMSGDCQSFRLVKSGDGWASIASSAGIALEDFYSWNPDVGASCSSLWAGYYVCVGVRSPDSTSRATPTSTHSGNGVATPTPVQPGMVQNCKSFRSVVSGDSCYDIAAAAGVSLNTFYAWNPAVGRDCGSLWVGYNVCIAVL